MNGKGLEGANDVAARTKRTGEQVPLLGGARSPVRPLAKAISEGSPRSLPCTLVDADRSRTTDPYSEYFGDRLAPGPPPESDPCGEEFLAALGRRDRGHRSPLPA